MPKDGSPTFHSDSLDPWSAIDMSICELKLVTNYGWKDLVDLHGSEHFPIELQNTHT